MFYYLILELIATIAGFVAFIFLITHTIRLGSVKRALKHAYVTVPLVIMFVSIGLGIYADKTYTPNFAMPMFMHSHAPGGINPDLPYMAMLNFFLHKDSFKEVADISRDPNDVGAPLGDRPPQEVHIALTVHEVISQIAPDIYLNYWTYDNTVPGPFLRVKEGDTVFLTLTNDKTSLHHHNIDLHAVNGPGGGSSLADVMPGETKTFKWKALNPGLYVYHCAMANVSSHNSHGQYGLIFVEPKKGLPKVDKEFYVMQGEFYTVGELGKRGLMAFDSQALIDGRPNYVVFNGRVDNATPRLHAKVGDKVRIYVGNGGVNLISSFHVIGEIFDTVYPEGAIGEGSTLLHNVQTTEVLPGGSTIVEFTLNAPGKYLLVDHALARMNKGAWAVLDVSGDPQGEVLSPVPAL